MAPYIEHEGRMIPGTQHPGGEKGLSEHTGKDTPAMRAVLDFAFETLGIRTEDKLIPFLNNLKEKGDEQGAPHTVSEIMEAAHFELWSSSLNDDLKQ